MIIYNTTIDQVGCSERVNRIFSRSIKKESKMWALKKILSMLDLTTLEGKYNYKLFQYDGSIIEDRMFLPKFVALPTILYLLMVVLLFILSNVLF